LVGPKQLALLVLSLTGVASTLGVENLQTYFTVTGVSMTCGLLAANLGSRAWKKLEFKPLPWARGIWTPFGFLAAYGLAVLVGLFVPFLGMRQVYRGGHSALRTINVSAFITALFYVLSDFDVIQKFLVRGAEVRYINRVHSILSTEGGLGRGGNWRSHFISMLLIYTYF
jgi:hypothetical protein